MILWENLTVTQHFLPDKKKKVSDLTVNTILCKSQETFWKCTCYLQYLLLFCFLGFVSSFWLEQPLSLSVYWVPKAAEAQQEASNSYHGNSDAQTDRSQTGMHLKNDLSKKKKKTSWCLWLFE